MNLTTDAWIPVVCSDGKPGMVSLRKAFERGDEIQDLALRPPERIAVTRLLICVAQAALRGPADYSEWKDCQPLIAPSAVKYLAKWRQAFELFGDGQRFLQVPNLRKGRDHSDSGDEEGGNSISKLDVALSTGNNSTLFDNAGGSSRSFTPAQLAVMLVTFQCFSPGGRIGVASWHGHQTAGKGSSNHAPCLANGMLHTLLRGDSLLAAVHSNLLNKRQSEQLFGEKFWGKPVWELMPQRPAHTEAVQNATRTYMGRLVPLSRAVYLADDCRSLILANGLDYPSYADGWREPCATVVSRTGKKEPERTILRVSIDRGVWRELHALTVKAVGQKPGGPLALSNISETEDAFDLWTGGLVADQAKLVDTTESIFHVPAAMLGETSQRVYENGVKHAETAEFCLRRAVSVFHKERGDNLDRPEMKNRRQQIQNNAATYFWTDIEQAVPRLLEVAERGSGCAWRETPWGQSVRRAARGAYAHACPHETARQMRAYALGLRVLLGTPVGEAEAATKEVDA